MSVPATAGVKEYWICDPQRKRTLVYNFDSEAIMGLYAFSEVVASTLFPGFEVLFSQVMAGM